MHTMRQSACGNSLWWFTTKELCEHVGAEIHHLTKLTPGAKDLSEKTIMAAHIQLVNYWQEACRDFSASKGQQDRVCSTEAGVEIALIPPQVSLNEAKTEFAVIINCVLD